MKRACPYDANLLKMSKVHLMDYDVDVTALQKVHDSTLQKLKDGARLPQNNITETLNTQPLTYNKAKPQKQMELTHYFKVSNESALFQFHAKPSPKAMIYDENETCYYCDKRKPTNSCLVCHEQFCSFCSLKRYNAAEEMHICLNCS